MSRYSQKRLEARIIQAVNTMIVRNEIKNLRPGNFTSISRVTLSKDNAYASLYVSCLDQTENRLQKAVSELARSAGYIQSRLGPILRTRNTPKLSFHPDTSVSEGQRINLLIDKLVGAGN